VRYPLQALRRLREEITHGRELELAALVSRHAAALEALRLAEARVAQCISELTVARAGLAEFKPRLAGEWQVGERFVERRSAALAAARVERGHAHARLTEEDAALAAGQARLRQAEAELETVERNHLAWDRTRRREEQRRAEQELEDVLAAQPAGAGLRPR
jgi:hypothetical protein